MYKVGMKVRIDPNLQQTSWSFGVVEEMTYYRGEITTITRINGSVYNLDADNGCYNWNSKWFSPLALNKGKE